MFKYQLLQLFVLYFGLQDKCSDMHNAPYDARRDIGEPFIITDLISCITSTTCPIRRTSKSIIERVTLIWDLMPATPHRCQ